MATAGTLSDEQKRQYNSFIIMAREMINKHDHQEALKHYQQAYQLNPSSKLEEKITKLVERMSLEVEGETSQGRQILSTKRPSPTTPLQEMKRPPRLVEEMSSASDKENNPSPLQDATTDGTGVKDDLPDDSQSLVAAGKNAIRSHDVPLALRCFRKAHALEPTDSLARRIARMEDYLKQQQGNQMDVDREETTAPHTEPSHQSSEASHPSPAKVEASTYHPTPSDNHPTPSDSHSRLTSASVNEAAPSDLSDEDIAVYNSLISQAKIEVRNGEFKEAISLYEQAYSLHPSDKLLSKITKLDSLKASQATPEEQTNQMDIETHYAELVTRGRQLLTQDNIQEALVAYKDAYGVKPSEKLERRIKRIEEYMKEKGQGGSDNSQPNYGNPEASSSPTIQQRHGSSTSTSIDMMSGDNFNSLINNAKQLIADGKVEEALTLYVQAATIRSSDKLSRKIQKCREYLESNEEAGADEFADVGNGFRLHQDLFSKLYPHQKESLLWFWGLHKKKTGGILADDMGLGKTIQVIAFLSGLFDADQVKSVIIVMPLSLIENWIREFDKWAPGIQVQVYHGGTIRERSRSLAKIQRRGGVLLTSYGMVVSSATLLSKKDGESFNREFTYDYVILDEGHKIKNPTKTSKGVHLIAAQHRIILTGTPIQNNLKEMWALFDWTHHGMLLGSARTFKQEYDKPITRGREKCATYGEKRLGEQMAESLKRIIAPYLLRRTKAEVKADTRARKAEGIVEAGPEMPNLKRKNDFVIWCYLSELQQAIYRSFCEQDEIKLLLNTSKSPLTALVVLKKICDHPRLMSVSQCHKLGLFTPQETLAGGDAVAKECAANTIKSVSDEILIEESGKLRFLVRLMAQLKKEGHRTLIFSLSRKMLDIVQKVLTNRGHKVLRMDGTITDLSEREKCVSSFQKSNVYDTFLLTTQVGGVGLTLTAADRVIIYDPSWNPATDSQAVDRAFRIGQDKNVCIYRLISCGTIEEKIYRRQIFKDSVNRTTMEKDERNLFRYFSNLELRELFQLDNPAESRTQQQLEQMHQQQRVTDTALDEHIAFLHSCEEMYGISDHDLMFSKEDEDLAGEENEENLDYIESRVSKAKERLQEESQMASKLLEEEGKYMPDHLRVLPVQKPKQVHVHPVDEKEPTFENERLFPEYNYGASADLQPANDWRTQVDPVNQSSHSVDITDDGIEANSTFHETREESGLPTTLPSPQATTSRLSANQFADSHLSSANDLTASHLSSANESPASPQGSANRLSDEIQNVARRLSASFQNQENSNLDGSSNERTEPQESTHVSEGDEEHMDTSQQEETSSQTRHEEGVTDMSIHMIDDEQAEMGGTGGDDQVTANVSEEVIAADSEDEEEVVLSDSDSDFEVVDDSYEGTDDSYEEVDDSQASALGDEFGQLHADYTVKDSEDDASYQESPAPPQKRRSTAVAPPPDLSFSEEELVESEDDE